MTKYHVFVRNWWTANADYPGGLEPLPGKKATICRCADSIEEARAIASRYNRSHNPGKLSRKAEFMEK